MTRTEVEDVVAEEAINIPRGREMPEDSVPPLKGRERLLVVSLGIIGTAMVGYLASFGIQYIKETPILILIPIVTGVVYLAGGYDHWIATRHN